MPNQWSESDYRKAGFVTVKLRLKKEVGEALLALVEASGENRAEVISQLITDKASSLGKRKKSKRTP